MVSCHIVRLVYRAVVASGGYEICHQVPDLDEGPLVACGEHLTTAVRNVTHFTTVEPYQQEACEEFTLLSSEQLLHCCSTLGKQRFASKPRPSILDSSTMRGTSSRLQAQCTTVCSEISVQAAGGVCRKHAGCCLAPSCISRHPQPVQVPFHSEEIVLSLPEALQELLHPQHRSTESRRGAGSLRFVVQSERVVTQQGSSRVNFV